MEASPATDVAFAVVYDVAASWENYDAVRSLVIGSAQSELVVHAAGRTADGFRIIDVWTSEAAWRRFQQPLDVAFDGQSVPPVVRELRVDHLLTPWAEARDARPEHMSNDVLDHR